jgi:hypothetical protein
MRPSGQARKPPMSRALLRAELTAIARTAAAMPTRPGILAAFQKGGYAAPARPHPHSYRPATDSQGFADLLATSTRKVN